MKTKRIIGWLPRTTGGTQLAFKFEAPRLQVDASSTARGREDAVASDGHRGRVSTLRIENGLVR